MRLSLRPSEDAFYDFFCKSADNLALGARALVRMAEPGADFTAISEKMVEIEHAGDEVTHEMLRKLNSTFVTPFDREDIYRLGSNLDDVIDHMEAAATLMHLYGESEIPDVPPEMAEQLNVLVQCARVTAEAMPRLKSRKSLEEYWIEINSLENEGDHAYRRLLARLFSGEYDALTVLKLKEVADELEAAADAFENVANTVETIAVKES